MANHLHALFLAQRLRRLRRLKALKAAREAREVEEMEGGASASMAQHSPTKDGMDKDEDEVDEKSPLLAP